MFCHCCIHLVRFVIFVLHLLHEEVRMLPPQVNPLSDQYEKDEKGERLRKTWEPATTWGDVAVVLQVPLTPWLQSAFSEGGFKMIKTFQQEFHLSPVLVLLPDLLVILTFANSLRSSERFRCNWIGNILANTDSRTSFTNWHWQNWRTKFTNWHYCARKNNPPTPRAPTSQRTRIARCSNSLMCTASWHNFSLRKIWNFCVKSTNVSKMPSADLSTPSCCCTWTHHKNQHVFNSFAKNSMNPARYESHWKSRVWTLSQTSETEMKILPQGPWRWLRLWLERLAPGVETFPRFHTKLTAKARKTR